MKKSLFRNFLDIGLGTLISMIVGVITIPVITRIVDPTQYGQLSIFNTYISLILMVLMLGLDQSFVRFFYSGEGLAYKKEVLRKCWLPPFFLALIFSALVLAAELIFSVRFEFSLSVTAILLVCVILEILNRFVLLNIRMQYDTKLYAALSVAQKTLYMVLALILILTWKGQDLLSLVLATMISFLIPTAIGILMKKEYWFGETGSQVSYRGLIRYGMPFILSMGLASLFQALDKLSINYFCDYAQVGIYTSAMQLANAFAIVQSTFNTMWAPMAIEHYEKDPKDREFYVKGNQIITVVMFALGILLILMKDVFAIFLGSKYREAAYVLPFLIFQPIMYTISETTVGGINFMKKSSMHIWIAAGACLANFIGNTLLVPIYGSKGAAVSTGLSYILFWFLRTVIANRYYYVDYRMKKICAVIGFTVFYAWYSAFLSFGWITVLLAAADMLLLAVLYRDTFRTMLVWAKTKWQNRKK